MGRPTECTHEVAERIAARIREVYFINTACVLEGIGRTAHYEWMERGEAGEEPFATYANTIKKARAEFETTTLESIKAGSQQWQRLSWFLDRGNPDDFGQKTRTEHSGTIDTAPSTLSPAEMARRRAEALDEETQH